ncbi:hypothetical protein NIES593_18375 [Hydrococcus rivularis NIES-593]|uniref:CheR-type methyltransferase domain-containing protein n=1 Tax=Hydrococcus rivularis NIES-593 TaxID=1921803 RepID=A0A1U7HA96_9CYAN|nr:CheR family methyltransferase [Hydrococcus rivularis]OKH20484.1 hypothetical protein NIES593_18375 [Hydrococcus rivularis NIES-593]
MKDCECVRFLQEILPKLHLRWSGFRRVRQQVCKRLKHRIKELGLEDFSSYSVYLATHAEEWSVVDACCRITISRFYRDSRVFEQLSQELIELARLATERGDKSLRCWSAGCASGEEVYTLKLIEHFCLAKAQFYLPLDIIATDIDEYMLSRASQGCYKLGTLKELPQEWIAEAFTIVSEQYCIKPTFKERIRFDRQDIRKEMPSGSFHLILCRNLVFTYFDLTLQWEILQQICDRLLANGILFIGKRESLPSDWIEGQLLPGSRDDLYRKIGVAQSKYERRDR